MRDSHARSIPFLANVQPAHTTSENWAAEYGFLIGRLIDFDTLATAARAADACGAHPHEVLLAEALISPASYVEVLSDHLRVAPERDAALPRTVLLDGTDGTPREIAARLHNHRLRGERTLLLDETALRQAERPERLAARAETAAFELMRRNPELSAGTPMPRWQIVVCAVPVLAAMALVAADTSAAIILTTAMALPFACVVALRTLALAFVRKPSAPVMAADWLGLPDTEMPHYSVLVPLYDEAELVPDLLLSLRKLDYPTSKLDVIIVLEAHDHATHTAFLRADLPGFVRVLTVPDMAPRTKPKALNYGLGFARGDYITVYDAEDMPEPNQLRRAAAAFRECGGEVCCLQARLNIYMPFSPRSHG